MVVALTGSDAPHAQTPATNQRVWTGTWEEHESWGGSNVVGRSQAEINFVYVEGRDEFGLPRWDSRRLTWSARWEETRIDQLVLGKFGEADDRGFYKNRYPADIVTVCDGGGTLELGPSAHDVITREQQEQMRPGCVTTVQPLDSTPAPPASLSKRDALPAPSLPSEYELTGCAYEKTWLMGTNGAGSLSVSVSAPVTAVMEVDPDPTGTYGSFVPVPGETLTFVASVPSGEARFRFELDPQATSHFPGYATNANIDEAFLAKHELEHLPGQYANDAPDMIFHPKHHSAQDWSRREPLVVETGEPQSAAVVTVTAMDYGAVGKLRAFVKSEECGDWQPVPVHFGRETRESIAIPMDEDNNLMADASDNYAAREPGVDDDAEPMGNGVLGDGLTAFEEYRGFVTSTNPTCESASGMSYIRTSPRTKDVFIHSPDPILAAEAAQFKDSSGLDVHLICPIHYFDNQTRVVNFTMQNPTRATFGGRSLTQNWPQHGLYLVDANLSAGIAGQSPIGPPGRVDKVEVDLTKLTHQLSDPRDLTRVVRHELGHAVGIKHHGDGNHWGPIVILNMSCRGWGMIPGRVAGQPACLVDFVAVRQGQNSGNHECPMKYVHWSWYVPPGQTLTAAGTVWFSQDQSWSWLRRRQYPAYEGKVLLYRTLLDRVGIGKFDHSNVGTGINGLAGDENHAGDSQRVCSPQLQVSDAPGSSQPAGP